MADRNIQPPLQRGLDMRLYSCYTLTPDEYILFHWLVSCFVYCFSFTEFYYGRERMQAETRIPRRQIEAIQKRFANMGILTTEIRTTGGKKKYFALDFGAVLEHLPEMADPSKGEQYKEIQDYFKQLHQCQKEARKQAQKGAKQEHRPRIGKAEIDAIYNELNRINATRYNLYNQEHEKKKNQIQLVRNGASEKAVARLAERYDRDTIKMAFVAFADWLIATPTEITNPIAYLAKYDAQGDNFPNFEHWLMMFRSNYGHN